jgi:hypothetical protein
MRAFNVVDYLILFIVGYVMGETIHPIGKAMITALFFGILYGALKALLEIDEK